MSKRLFGGAKLGEIATSAKDRPAPKATDAAPIKPVLPTAELALQGRTSPGLTRETVLSVDPRRCRPWKYHNRTAAWYTRERCEDLIESIPKDGQQEPALARRITDDPQHDYELIYGMRRRYACEVTNAKLKIRVVEIPDSQAAILMSGKAGDAAWVDLRSIGGLGANVNRKLTQQVCNLLNESLGIAPERVYLNFTNVEAGNWGWNENTFG